MNLASKLSAAVFLMFTIFTGCTNDFDLNADYSRQPVVYGVLDPDRADQIIMINHTFLGGGSAFDYALIEDSTLYDNVDARIFWNDGDDSVELTQTVIDDKDTDGLFYAPNQTVYTAPTSEFNFGANPDDEYRIGVMADGDTIFASTQLVNFNPLNVDLPNPVSNNLVNSSSDPFINPLYLVLKVKFRTIENAIKHKVSIRLTYNEVYVGGGSEMKSLEFDVQSFDASDQFGGDEQGFDYETESFYQTVGNRLTPNASVDYRDFVKVEVVFYSFGSDLSNYIDISNPSSGGVGQETPAYSNINDGEGRGVFSARSSYVREINISNNSIRELIQGQYTNDLGFCYAGIVNCL